MRKLALACALAAAALFAQGARAESAQQKAKSDARDVGGAAQKTGERWKEAGQRAVGSSGSVDAKMFEGKSNFDLDGKISHVSGESITISRKDLPPATLGIARGAKVQLDGNDVSVQQLKEGQDVKASFNLDKDKAEAVEIKAKRTDAQKDAQKAHEQNQGSQGTSTQGSMNRNDMNGPNKAK